MYDLMLTLTDAEPSGTKAIDEMSVAELKAHREALTKDIDTRPPVQIVSFEC